MQEIQETMEYMGHWGHRETLGSQRDTGVTEGHWGHRGTLGPQRDTGVTERHWGHRGTLGPQRDTGVIEGHWGHRGSLGSQRNTGVIEGHWGHRGKLGSHRDRGSHGENEVKESYGEPRAIKRAQQTDRRASAIRHREEGARRTGGVCVCGRWDERQRREGGRNERW